ncbi:MFS transporter [Mycetocola zhadangensis]|uniref:MFS transporter n=2 Tax=Mycetocola zhadangensis TaxID=1164595 RepID=A0A3L7J7A4_9MICO|nr:MFS transporter [Mycetocola zhadangensis]
MAQLTPIQLLLPLQVDAAVSPDNWVDSVVAFGIISGAAGLCALVVYPLTGALSDRTTSRFGRRRPWIAAGTVLFAGSLAVLAFQGNIVGIGVAWCAALSGFCMLTAALTAVISDQVPVTQRGTVSGWMSAPQAVGIILGVALVTFLSLGQLLGYLVVSVALVVLVLPLLFAFSDEVLPVGARARLTFRTLVSGFWIDPRTHPDFGWTLLGRVLVNLGNALGTTLLLYFLQYGLKIEQAEDGLLALTLVYMIFVILASVILGNLSDRLGRRKSFIVAAAGLQGIAALILAFVPSFDAALLAAGLLGMGYGCFLSVDQALATQVLPAQEDRGKDLGIMNIAMAAPQAFAPLFGAMIVATFGSFPALFVAAGAAAILGALAILPVRSVR